MRIIAKIINYRKCVRCECIVEYILTSTQSYTITLSSISTGKGGSMFMGSGGDSIQGNMSHHISSLPWDTPRQEDMKQFVRELELQLPYTILLGGWNSYTR